VENMHIKCNSISKVFPISIRENIYSLLSLLYKFRFFSKSSIYNKFCNVALQNISFEISEGESVGIIGRNGAGKSTLLRIISGMSTPSSGTVEIDGRVDCILSLGTGIHDEITGRENIFRDGKLKGKGDKEILSVLDSIIKFADLGSFIDQPVKTYSSGMKARLAFSMITCLSPEILIIDEALGTGDYDFAAKAASKMKEICKKGKILLLVSHSMKTITEMCNRCIWLEKGSIKMDGAPDVVTREYLEFIRKEDEIKLSEKLKIRLSKERITSDYFSVREIGIAGTNQHLKYILDYKESFILRVILTCTGIKKNLTFGIEIERIDGILILKDFHDFPELIKKIPHPHSTITVSIGFNNLFLGKNSYIIRFIVVEKESQEVFLRESLFFKIKNDEYTHTNPIVWSECEWKFN
jgi:lipopolysaccharide transport system ATP-binding protein